MSTFYATFQARADARDAVDELIRGGVSPDDLSLIGHCDSSSTVIQELSHTVGDATSFVGRGDDPARDPFPNPTDLTEFTTTEMSPISPIDTSDANTDVESMDQMTESQEESERQSRPRDGISHSTHEVDDLALAVTTGFPTLVTALDDIPQDPFAQEEQFGDSVEALKIPGFGLVVGGGSLATAALDFANQNTEAGNRSLVSQLVDDGVPIERANDLQKAFGAGGSLLAVVITPGQLNEDAVEEIAERHRGVNQGLFDAPRYYDSEQRATV